MFQAPGGPGIPVAVAVETLVVAPFDDIEGTGAALEPHMNELAAVIVEPVLGSGGVLLASDEFLRFLRELTRDAGAPFVFDEIIWVPGGLQRRAGPRWASRPT